MRKAMTFATCVIADLLDRKLVAGQARFAAPSMRPVHQGGGSAPQHPASLRQELESWRGLPNSTGPYCPGNSATGRRLSRVELSARLGTSRALARGA